MTQVSGRWGGGRVHWDESSGWKKTRLAEKGPPSALYSCHSHAGVKAHASAFSSESYPAREYPNSSETASFTLKSTSVQFELSSCQWFVRAVVFQYVWRLSLIAFIPRGGGVLLGMAVWSVLAVKWVRAWAERVFFTVVKVHTAPGWSAFLAEADQRCLSFRRCVCVWTFTLSCEI